MSSLVLLNNDGTVAKKLELVSLPEDYTIPEGKILSWRTVLRISSNDPLVNFSGNREPVEAYFYLGSAWAQVSRAGWKDYERNAHLQLNYGVRTLTITVQGNPATDLMKLRDQVLGLIHSGVRYNISNDMNPKPSILETIRRCLRRQPKKAALAG